MYEMFLSDAVVPTAFLLFVARTDGTWHDVPNVLEQHKRISFSHTSAVVCCAPQVGFDGPLSAQEQMYILYEIKLQCYENLSNIDPGSTGTERPRATLQTWPSNSKFARPELR